MILRYIIPHCPYLVNDFNLIRHKELIDTDIPAGNFMLTVFTAFSQLDIDSFRASRLPKHYTSTLCESLSSPIGRGSGSSMGNGNRRTSQGVTLYVEWICQQTPFTAVCVSMNFVTASPNRPQLDRQVNGKAIQHRPSLRGGNITAEKKKPSEMLTKRFRELAVIQFQ